MQRCMLISQSKDFGGVAHAFGLVLEAKASGQKFVIGSTTQEQRDKLKRALVRFGSSSCQAGMCKSRDADSSPTEWLSPVVLAL